MTIKNQKPLVGPELSRTPLPLYSQGSIYVVILVVTPPESAYIRAIGNSRCVN